MNGSCDSGSYSHKKIKVVTFSLFGNVFGKFNYFCVLLHVLGTLGYNIATRNLNGLQRIYEDIYLWPCIPFMARIHCSKQFTNVAMSQMLTTSHPIQKRVYFVSLTMYHHKRISVSMAKNSWTYYKYTEISYPHKNSVGTFSIQWHHCEVCLKGMVTSRVKEGSASHIFSGQVLFV